MNEFAGHTPGPWFILSGHILAGSDNPMDDGDALAIADIDMDMRIDFDTTGAANAALIAAAPTLLAQRDALADALRALLPPERGIHGGPLVCGVWRYEDGTDENSARHKGQIAPHTVAKARAALALLETEK